MKTDSKGNVMFTAKGGAWFMIVFCTMVLGFLGWLIIDGIADSERIFGSDELFYDVLFYVLMIFLFVYCCFLMVYSINRLKAKITIGPEGLVLEGAIDKTERRRNPFHRDYIKSDLVVEIRWQDIQNMDYDDSIFVTGNWCLQLLPHISRLKIETKENRRYVTNLSFFSPRAVMEIKKYREKHNIRML